MSKTILYNTRKRLNPLSSTYTGSVVITRTLDYDEDLTVVISDYSKMVRLHDPMLKASASKKEREKHTKAFLKKKTY